MVTFYNTHGAGYGYIIYIIHMEQAMVTFYNTHGAGYGYII